MSTPLETWLEKKADVYLLIQKIDGKKKVYWSFDGAPSPAYVPMIKKSEAIAVIEKLKEALEGVNYTYHDCPNNSPTPIEECTICPFEKFAIEALAIDPEKL